MIGRIAGILLEKSPPQIVVDVQGVGYEIDVPMSTFYGLPASGQEVRLFTHLAIREDGHFLYGFGTAEERAAFRKLVKVSGVGARTALAILSGMTVADLNQAIARQETARLVRVPGIGKKTAERLLLELRDKLGAATNPAGAPADSPHPLADNRSDVLHALLALGYNDREASGAIRELGEETPVSDGIRQALKLLSKS